MRWYVVQTKPRKEELVRVLFETAGLTVFLPRVLEYHRGRRRMREQVNLMFPGYLFVKMNVPRHFSRVRWTQGVRKVLGGQEAPSAVDEGLIRELEARMGRKGYLIQKTELKPGDRVEVRHGSFAGLLGLVELPSTGRERVRVLLTLFDRRTTVELDERHLVRVGNS